MSMAWFSGPAEILLLAVGGPIAVETAIETDSAFGFGEIISVETAVETDSAFNINAGSQQLLATAVETDTAFTISAYTLVTHHLYRSTTSGFVPGPANKIGDSLGLTFVFVDDEPLDEQTTYYYVAGAVVSELGEVFSDEIAVTTLTQLALLLAGEGVGEFAHAEDDVAVEIQYQTTTNADSGFATPIDDVIKTGLDRRLYNVTGLTLGATYRTRARTRPSSVGAFERWSKVVVWVASDVDFDASVSSRFTSPPFAFLMRGVAAVMSWSAAAAVTGVEISDDLGVTWTPLTGWSQTGITFDTTVFPDGAYIVRVSQASACQYFYHGGFLIDNAVEATYEDDFYTAPRPAMARYWNPSITRWLPTVPLLIGSTGHIGVSPVASFGPTEPPELTQCRGVIFMGECVAMGTGAGFQWDRTQAGDLLEMGLIVLGSGALPGGIPVGVRVNIEHFFMTSALGTTQRPIPDLADPFRFVGVGQANEHNRLEVVVGALGAIPDAGWHKFSLPCPVAMGWTRMTLGASQYVSAGRLRPYQFILWVVRPDPTNFPARIRVRARVDGPDAWSCSGRQQLLIDETIDVEQPVDATTVPYEFIPGHIAFYTDKIAGNRSGDSGRFLTRYSAVIISEPGPPPDVPESPPTDSPEVPDVPPIGEEPPPFGENEGTEACFLIPYECIIEPVPGSCEAPTAAIVAYICKEPELILVFGEECIPVAIQIT